MQSSLEFHMITVKLIASRILNAYTASILVFASIDNETLSMCFQNLVHRV